MSADQYSTNRPAMDPNCPNCGQRWPASAERQQDQLSAAAPALLALAQQYASECSRCGGTGLCTITTYPGGIEVDNDEQPCQECADIRAVIAKAQP